MLHYNYMRKFAAVLFDITVCKHIFLAYPFGRAFEKYSVTVRHTPSRVTDTTVCLVIIFFIRLTDFDSISVFKLPIMFYCLMITQILNKCKYILTVYNNY